MAKMNHIQRVHIWDDPESRINFLETTLKDKEWSAVIYEPVMEGTGRLESIKKILDKKDYKTTIGTDSKGNATLTIKRFGADTDLLTAIEEMGLVKGISHTFKHLGTNLTNLLDTGKKILSKWTENKMKFIGLTYLMGDIVMIGTAADPAPMRERILKGGYGVLGAAQSLIFMNYAATADQQLSKELNRKFKNAENKGLILEPSENWLNAADTRSKTDSFMEKNAVTAGALTQITGRLLWITSGYLQNERDPDSNGKNRMKDGAFSIMGWCLMMMKGEKKEGETVWDIIKSNPLRLVSYYSNQLAGGFNAWSTVEGIKGSLKETKAAQAEYQKAKAKAELNNEPINLPEPKGAAVELAGNLTYAIGDATVFLTRTADYDEKSATHAKTLAKVATGFLAELPLAIGQKKKAEMMENISNYLAVRSVEIDQKKDKKNPIKNPEEETKRRAAAVYNEIVMELPQKDIGLWPIIQKTVDASQNLANEKREQFLINMIDYLESVPNVLADKAEIQELIQTALQKQKPITVESENIKEFNEALTKLLEAIPGVEATPQLAMEIYTAANRAPKEPEAAMPGSGIANFTQSLGQAKSHPRVNQSAEAGVGAGMA